MTRAETQRRKVGVLDSLGVLARGGDGDEVAFKRRTGFNASRVAPGCAAAAVNSLTKDDRHS